MLQIVFNLFFSISQFLSFFLVNHSIVRKLELSGLFLLFYWILLWEIELELVIKMVSHPKWKEIFVANSLALFIGSLNIQCWQLMISLTFLWSLERVGQEIKILFITLFRSSRIALQICTKHDLSCEMSNIKKER